MNELLNVTAIHKSFFGAPVLRDISFALSAGEVLGLVGENGAGKSTLMNVLGGVVLPESGTLTLNGQPYVPATPADATRAGIAFVHQELNLFTNLSLAENLFLPDFPRRRMAGLSWIDRQAMHQRAAELLAQVGLQADPRALLETLSLGERQLVEIARALHQQARLIIFDEPTTSLTARETDKLFALMERLRAQGIAMIYISHVLEDVLRVCDQVLVLRDGAIVASDESVNFTFERLITLMVGRDLAQLYPPRVSQPAAAPILQANGLTQPGVLAGVSFTLHRGEVLGLAGLMGAGRTELARILFGLDPCANGTIELNGVALHTLSTRERIRCGLALLTENRREEGLLMEASVADNTALVALPAFARNAFGLIEQTRLQAALDEIVSAVQVRGADLKQQVVKTLSGGNQQKVVLAKWLLQKPAVFILDEPTRGVDIGARAEIYQLIHQLVAEGAGVLFLSSEIEELIGMCDRVLVLCRGKLTASFARGEFDREQILKAALPAQ